MPKLLTIAVPTYNRHVHLARLLAVLGRELDDHAADLDVIVSDNASTDGTRDLLDNLASAGGPIRIVRNATNLGADANIVQCYDLALSEHVWIMGDDDLPKTGAIGAVLAVLRAERPDLVYLPSRWSPEVTSPDQGDGFDPSAYESMDRERFARRVNIWFTFLSGIVVKKSAAEWGTEDRAALSDSCLIQLSWVMAALRDGAKFCAFRQELMLATAGNTGDYAVIEVFGSNLARAVGAQFGRRSAMYKAIMLPTVIGYLPQLVWNVRYGTAGRFDTIFSWRPIDRELGSIPAFWLFVRSVGSLPRPLARCGLYASRVMAAVMRRLS